MFGAQKRCADYYQGENQPIILSKRETGESAPQMAHTLPEVMPKEMYRS